MLCLSLMQAVHYNGTVSGFSQIKNGVKCEVKLKLKELIEVKWKVSFAKRNSPPIIE